MENTILQVTGGKYNSPCYWWNCSPRDPDNLDQQLSGIVVLLRQAGAGLHLLDDLPAPAPRVHPSWGRQQVEHPLDEPLLVEPGEDVLLVLCALHAGDEAEEEVHDGGGGEVGEQQAGEAGLGLDVLNDLEARILVRVPVLYQPCKDNSQLHE